MLKISKIIDNISKYGNAYVTVSFPGINHPGRTNYNSRVWVLKVNEEGKLYCYHLFISRKDKEKIAYRNEFLLDKPFDSEFIIYEDCIDSLDQEATFLLASIVDLTLWSYGFVGVGAIDTEPKANTDKAVYLLYELISRFANELTDKEIIKRFGNLDHYFTNVTLNEKNKAKPVSSIDYVVPTIEKRFTDILIKASAVRSAYEKVESSQSVKEYKKNCAEWDELTKDKRAAKKLVKEQYGSFTKTK